MLTDFIELKEQKTGSKTYLRILKLINLGYMKYVVYLFLFALLNTPAFAQSGSKADAALARAGLCHLQKDYLKAIQWYEVAFKISPPDALSAYKAAGVYSLAGNAEKAEYYLKLALQKGWAESLWLMEDPYFDNLKHADLLRWSRLVAQAVKNELEYEKKLGNPGLRRKINLMVVSDQQLRYRKAQTQDPKELEKINQELTASDQKNWSEAKNIVEAYGWPKLSDIGKDGQNNLWLIVQHADHDVAFQRKVLEKMKLLIKSKQVNLENYAFLSDRVLCNLNYLQEFGTQVQWTTNGMASGFRDIRREWEVDKRRKRLGLPGLTDYALTYGFTYEKPSEQDCRRVRKQILQKVKSLIDTAQTAYEGGDFQRTYDNYNAASTFAEGMSDDQSLKAAMLFSMIAAKVKDNQKYRDISFDFLNLLNLRNRLDKTSLKQMHEFEAIHQDTRWLMLVETK